MADSRGNNIASLNQRKTLWTRFTVTISIIVGGFLVTIFAGLFFRNINLMEGQLLNQARTHFHSIVVTRAWNAQYGGVFVEKKDGVTSNPWLENPDITCTDGRVLTLRNPAIMTREISERTASSSLISFHITSQKPVNPGNVPDCFEKEALAAFQQGKQEFFRQIKDGESTNFRYAAPLFVEESCLSCHAKHGYKLGDIRGTVSVTFDITEAKNNLRLNSEVIFTLCAASLLALLAIIYYFIKRIMKVLDAAHERISELASTDELTQLPNRRAFFTRMKDELDRSKRYGHCLSCIMLDLDHFKNVNDTYGHNAGDMVLTKVAAIILAVKRASDVAARYGGEEIVLMLPETNDAGALTMAEKIRTDIESHTFDIGNDRSLNITASLGVACACSTELINIETPDDLLRIADKALYAAKDAGRNRVRARCDLSS